MMIRWLSLILLGASAVSAQQPAPAAAQSAELRALREKFRQMALEAESSAAEQRRAALTELERQRAESGDYEGARRVRELLREDAGKTAAAADNRKPVALKGVKGSPTGSAVTMQSHQPEGVRLNRDGAAVEWSVSSIQPGRYEVILRGGVEEAASGNGEGKRLPSGPVKDEAEAAKIRTVLKEAKGSYGEAAGGVIAFEQVSGIDKQPPLLYCLTPQGTWSDVREFNLGIIEVKGTIATFRVRSDAADRKGLLHLTEVELIPKAALTAGMSASEHEFENLRETYRTVEKDRSKTADREWLERLDKLEAVYLSAGDSAGAAKVQEERLRLTPAGPRTFLVSDPLICKTRGDIRLTNSKEFLTRLRAGSQVTWDLARGGATAGKWDVTLTAMVAPGHGGEAVLAAGSNELEVKLASPNPPEDKKKPKTESGNSEPPPKPVLKEIDAGTLTIGAGQRELVLRIVQTAHADGGLFDLKSITLKPAAKK